MGEEEEVVDKDKVHLDQEGVVVDEKKELLEVAEEEEEEEEEDKGLPDHLLVAQGE